jgi:acid stress chaperone HdeB
MRKLILILAIAMTVAPGSGQAQMTIDMSRVTCANYLAMSPDQTSTFSAWMSGWFNHKWGYVWVGLNDFARNIASIKQFCTTSPQETVMAALERSIPQPAPVTGQIKIDMSLITCKQYLGSDAERKELIGAWMSGYFRASTNQSIFDFQRFAKNTRTVANYCKKHGGETVMSAIQKSAR